MKSLGWIVAALLAVALLVSIGSQSPPQPTPAPVTLVNPYKEDLVNPLREAPPPLAGNYTSPAPSVTSDHDHAMEQAAREQAEAARDQADALQTIANAQRTADH